MKNIFLTLILTFFLASCITVEIGENGYNSLKYLEKHHIASYAASVDYDPTQNSECFKIFEIDSNDFYSAMQEKDFTWIHLWNPYCKNDHCINIKQFETLSENHQESDLQLLFVSTTYDFDHILSRVNNSSFTETVYLLNGGFYGSKLKEVRQKVHFDLDKNASPDDSFFNDNYLFYKDSLVYAGNAMNDSILFSHTVKYPVTLSY